MNSRRATREGCRGVTLIELLVTIVIIALAGTAVVGTLSFVATSSGRSLGDTQANAIANAYLAEVLSKPFSDPAGLDNEVTRLTFDDVDDYDGFVDANARDQFGNALGGVGQFRVTVSAVNSGNLGPFVPAAGAIRVDVTVTTPTGTIAVATGYRTSHP